MRTGFKGAAAALVVGVAGLSLGPLAGAASPPTRAAINGTISPAVADLAPKPVSAALSIVATFQTNPPGSQPATVTKAVVFFGHGSTVNSRLFPSCPNARLNKLGPSACPRGSRIGGGSATALGAGVVETLKITAFNGPHGRSVLLYLHANSPIKVAQSIQAPLVPVRTKFYAFQLTLPVPANLQVIAGVPVAVTRFSTTVKGTVMARVHGRRVRRGYVEVPLCPPGALVPLRGVFTFAGAPTQTVNSGIACGQPPPA